MKEMNLKEDVLVLKFIKKLKKKQFKIIKIREMMERDSSSLGRGEDFSKLLSKVDKSIFYFFFI
jgi:DNA-binding transcriptional MerR regulator